MIKTIVALFFVILVAFCLVTNTACMVENFKKEKYIQGGINAAALIFIIFAIATILF